MNFSSSRKRPPLALELTPLIDVVFLLLIFFMVSTTFVSDEGGLSVELPRSEQRDLIQEAQDVALVLGANGAIELDGQAMGLEAIGKALRERAERDPSTLVVVRADRSIEHGRVVEIMDRVREVGLTRFAIATETAGASPQ
ncbi:MAG: biopolymer transporter ExbD [Rickettsiales bacterium]|nr:biopolymer transporter ExbD [Rickettsiales bacterium]